MLSNFKFYKARKKENTLLSQTYNSLTDIEIESEIKNSSPQKKSSFMLHHPSVALPLIFHNFLSIQDIPNLSRLNHASYDIYCNKKRVNDLLKNEKNHYLQKIQNLYLKISEIHHALFDNDLKLTLNPHLVELTYLNDETQRQETLQLIRIHMKNIETDIASRKQKAYIIFCILLALGIIAITLSIPDAGCEDALGQPLDKCEDHGNIFIGGMASLGISLVGFIALAVLVRKIRSQDHDFVSLTHIVKDIKDAAYFSQVISKLNRLQAKITIESTNNNEHKSEISHIRNEL